MRTLISLIVDSVFVAISSLALADTVSAEPAKTETSATPATSGNPAETAKSATPANATEPPKPNAESELPTCVPK